MNQFASGPEAPLLRQRRRHRLSPEPRWPDAGRPEPGVRRERADAAVRRRLLEDLHRGRQHGLIATDSMKNFIQRETMNFDGFRSRGVLPVSRRQVSWRRTRKSRGCRFQRRKFRFAPLGGERRVRAGRPGARDGANRNQSHAASSRSSSGLARLQAAAARRQRVSRVRPRRVHDAAGSHESAAAHVARSRMALHRRRRRHSAGGAVTARGAADRARGVRVVRVGKHPAGDLSDGDQDCSPIFPRSRRSTSRPTIALGIRLPSKATSWVSTRTRGRRMGVWG